MGLSLGYIVASLYRIVQDSYKKHDVDLKIIQEHFGSHQGAFCTFSRTLFRPQNQLYHLTDDSHRQPIANNVSPRFR